MATAAIPSFKALARQAQVSEWAVRQLRSDRISTMRLETLEKLAIALNMGLPEFLGQFAPSKILNTAGTMAPGSAENPLRPQIDALKVEYDRLQTRLQQQEPQLRSQFQREAIAVLESWLLQWPTVAHAVEKNPDLPASRVVPLVQPVQDLLAAWGIEAIAPVGTETAFDPQQHELLKGDVKPGDPVRVRYTGYRQGETLLHRAKVSPIA